MTFISLNLTALARALSRTSSKTPHATPINAKTSVLMVGVAECSDILLRSDDPGLVDFRKTQPAGQLEKYCQVTGDIDAIHFVGHASPIPLLLQLPILSSTSTFAGHLMLLDFAQHWLDVDDWRAIDGFDGTDSQTLLAYFAHGDLMKADWIGSIRGSGREHSREWPTRV